MKSDDRREEREALLGLRREQLDVAEMRDVAEAGKWMAAGRSCALSFCKRLLKGCHDVGDEIVDGERPRQQTLRVSGGDRHFEIPAVRCQSKRR